MIDFLLIPADPDQVERERRKSKELKKSAWWKNRLGEGKCYYCSRRFHPSLLTMDHVVPLIRGGTSARGNCVPACQECNHRKNNLPAGDWKIWLERQEEARESANLSAATTSKGDSDGSGTDC